ncbi:hypothetical protein WISP_149380 [Willisornis vidua]|uniref:Uncharacterized protein n=1 Tax=Willisornis vidua TaxID=1566151 RepID=A0ABQ9CQ62_9PASS|nr:hypothetical protein WISP_149380 [Willisornis vidua]
MEEAAEERSCSRQQQKVMEEDKEEAKQMTDKVAKGCSGSRAEAGDRGDDRRKRQKKVVVMKMIDEVTQ